MRDQPVLSKRQPVIRVADHLEAEASISACVPQRPRRRPSNRQPAEHERARIERDLLTPLVACRADEFDGFDAFLLAFGGKELYVVFVCQLTHYGLHVLHTRVAGPVDLAIRGPERLQRLLSRDRVQSCVQLPPKWPKRRAESGPERHRKSII